MTGNRTQRSSQNLYENIQALRNHKDLGNTIDALENQINAFIDALELISTDDKDAIWEDAFSSINEVLRRHIAYLHTDKSKSNIEAANKDAKVLVDILEQLNEFSAGNRSNKNYSESIKNCVDSLVNATSQNDFLLEEARNNIQQRLNTAVESTRPDLDDDESSQNSEEDEQDEQEEVDEQDKEESDDDESLENSDQDQDDDESLQNSDEDDEKEEWDNSDDSDESSQNSDQDQDDWDDDESDDDEQVDIPNPTTNIPTTASPTPTATPATSASPTPTATPATSATPNPPSPSLTLLQQYEKNTTDLKLKVTELYVLLPNLNADYRHALNRMVDLLSGAAQHQSIKNTSTKLQQNINEKLNEIKQALAQDASASALLTSIQQHVDDLFKNLAEQKELLLVSIDTTSVTLIGSDTYESALARHLQTKKPVNALTSRATTNHADSHLVGNLQGDRFFVVNVRTKGDESSFTVRQASDNTVFVDTFKLAHSIDPSKFLNDDPSISKFGITNDQFAEIFRNLRRNKQEITRESLTVQLSALTVNGKPFAEQINPAFFAAYVSNAIERRMTQWVDKRQLPSNDMLLLALTHVKAIYEQDPTATIHITHSPHPAYNLAVALYAAEFKIPVQSHNYATPKEPDAPAGSTISPETFAAFQKINRDGNSPMYDLFKQMDDSVVAAQAARAMSINPGKP